MASRCALATLHACLHDSAACRALAAVWLLRQLVTSSAGAGGRRCLAPWRQGSPEQRHYASRAMEAWNLHARLTPCLRVQAPLLPGRPQDPRRAQAHRRWQLLRVVGHFQNARVRHQRGDTYLITDSVQSYTLWESCKRLNFWLLTFACAACTGCSLAFNNNIAPLATALGGSSTQSVRCGALLAARMGAKCSCMRVCTHGCAVHGVCIPA